MKYDKKKFVLYIAITFALGWVLQVVASLFALKGESVLFSQILAFSMFAPFVAVLFARISIKESGLAIKIKGNIPMILVAWFSPALLTAIGSVLYFMIVPNRLDLTFSYVTSSYTAEMLEQIYEAGYTIPSLVGLQAIQALTWAPIINGVFAFGEEIGWRGAMYPMLKDKFGTNKGRIMGGAIWGAWHWPVMILAGYEYGFDYWGYPVVGMLLFCVFTVVFGIFLDAIYEKSGCIWIPSVAHGALNAIATLPLAVLNTEYLNEAIIGPAPMGLIAMIPLIAVAVVISFKNKSADSKN